MFKFKAILFFSILMAIGAGRGAKYQHTRPQQALSNKENDRPPPELRGEAADLEAVIRNQNKCRAIAKKKRKSFADNLYYRIRCRGFKLPKPKLSKPKIPKIRKPKLPMLPRLPKHPKINPKAIPKIPRLTVLKPRRTPSPSPKPKRHSKRKPSKRQTQKKGNKSTRHAPKPKKPTPRPRKKPTPRKAEVQKPRPSPTRTAQPRPRRAPSPVVSQAKLKSSFESAKKRLTKNIRKREASQLTAPTLCKTEEYTCGKKCSGRPGPPFLCFYPNNVPRLCTRKAAVPGFCPGQTRERTCTRSIMEPATCTRNVTITEYCPGSERGCRFKDVPFRGCPHDCERIKKLKCSYKKRKITTACAEPLSDCSDCKSGSVLKTCLETIMERVELPCGQGRRILNFEEELLGKGVESRYTRDAVCFDSFFDEAACMHAPRVCRLLDELFDRRLCAEVVCRQCGELMGMLVSDEVQGFCKRLLTGSCRAAGVLIDTEEESKKGKCYGERSVQKAVPCYDALPSGAVCERGCVTKACSRVVHEVSGFCERNLPDFCRGDVAGCEKDTKVTDCSKERICEYVVTKPYLCFRERDVEIPCEGGCETEGEERFVCGSLKKEVEGVCRERFEYRCQDVRCSRRVCA